MRTPDDRNRLEIVLGPCADDPDEWYWLLKIDGEPFMDGSAQDECSAFGHAATAYHVWVKMNLGSEYDT